MAGFTQYSGQIAVLSQDDIDTDKIIPARYLSRVNKTGYGELAFSDLRGPEFPLDQPAAKNASILVVGFNFGCGSSREHAVWAIQQAGFKVVIGQKSGDRPGFSDIFRSNSGNCGLALIELNKGDHDHLVAAGSGATATVDLPNQTIEIGGNAIRFEINQATKNQLVQGLDLIGMTLVHEPEIAAFESNLNQ